MKPLGQAALLVLFVLVGLFAWLEFFTDLGNEALLPTADEGNVGVALDSADVELAESVPAPPDPILLEDSPSGPIPRVGENGRQPWQAYARPFDRSDKRPRIVLIIINLGQKADVTNRAIEELPGAVTLAFSPYAPGLEEWAERARRRGHETLLAIPMEPIGYPETDPGAKSLLTSLSPQENRDRLRWVMARMQGYTGLVAHMGSRFLATPDRLVPALREVEKRGLMFVDNRAGIGNVVPQVARELKLPIVRVDIRIDEFLSAGVIDTRLAELAELARTRGLAVGAIAPYPISIERASYWIKDLAEAGLTLAPASAIATPSR